MTELGKKSKNKIIGYLKNQEAKILIFSFILIESIFIFDAISSQLLKSYGLLVILSFLPWIYLIIWSLRSKSKLLGISIILGFIIFIIYFLFFRNSYFSKIIKDNIIQLIPSISKGFNQYNKHYLSLHINLILSMIYGIICMISCFTGLKISKKSELDKRFPEITKNIIFISIAITIYLFLIEKMIHGDYLEFKSLIMAFLFIVIAFSSLYTIFGYFSQNNYGNPIPIVFFIYSLFSFVIGTTFSILILQFIKNVQKPGIFPTHWVFLCIWTLFISGTIYVLSKDISGLSTYLKSILK